MDTIRTTPTTIVTLSTRTKAVGTPKTTDTTPRLALEVMEEAMEDTVASEVSLLFYFYLGKRSLNFPISWEIINYL